MKKLIITLSLFIIASSLFASSKKIINKSNEFGGITEQHKLSRSDNGYDQFHIVDFYYDENKNLRKKTYYLTDEIKDEMGIESQDEIYTDGYISDYVMHLTKERTKREGITIIYEHMNPNGSTKYLEHTNGTLIAGTLPNTFVYNYPFYNLSYVEAQFEFETEPHEQNIYYTSAKYVTGRTFVKFADEFNELEDLDKDIIKFFADSLNNPDAVNAFSAKTIATTAEGKDYVVYLQKSIMPYLKEGMECLLDYRIIGCNEKLYLIMTEFNEVKKVVENEN